MICKKTVLCVALVVVVALAACTKTQAQKANPESDFEVKNINGDKAVEITNYVGVTQNVVIPSKIRGLPVTSIGEGAFWEKNLTSVIIPNGVTYIGDKAFVWNQLTSVAIPNSVTYIGEGAFTENQLTSVAIPNSVTYIGEGAFFANQLTSVTIPNSVTYIGDKAFVWNQLTSVTIPNSIRYASRGELDGEWVFDLLSDGKIPNGVTIIESSAFDEDVKITRE